MKREEEIKKAGSEYTENYDCFDGDIDDIEIGFIDGAEWADVHPKNFWHSVADGDLPPKAKNNNRLAFGRYDYTYKSWYVGLQRVYPTHWAEIPELPTE